MGLPPGCHPWLDATVWVSSLWLVSAALGRKPSPSVESQLDREVIALRDHVEDLEKRLAGCTSDQAPNALYPELKQVFAGSEVRVDKVGTATRLTLALSVVFSDPYQMKFVETFDSSMDLVATALHRNPGVMLLVVGHTHEAEIPPAFRRTWPSGVEWSVSLSGTFVRRLVQEFGADPARFFVAGRGPFSPVAPNDTEEGQAANRRLELWFYPQASPGAAILPSACPAPLPAGTE